MKTATVKTVTITHQERTRDTSSLWAPPLLCWRKCDRIEATTSKRIDAEHRRDDRRRKAHPFGKTRDHA